MKTTACAQRAESVAIVGIILNFLFGCLVFLISYSSRSESVYMEGWHLSAGSLIWLLVFLHARQKRLALEEESFSREPVEKDQSLFKEEEMDPFSARSRLIFFEKWIVPIATLSLAILFLLGGMALFYNLIKKGKLPSIQNAPLLSAFLGGVAFFSLLVSKYALGMSKEKVWKFLHPGGTYLLVNCVACFLCMLSLALTEIQIYAQETYLSYGISILISLLGLEMGMNLVLDIYRPKIKDQEIHPPYASRFLELCTGSKGILKTAAQTLDYQFGFKVSETWFYAFLEKAIAPLILFQLLSLYLLSCVVIVSPQEQAIVERFGKPAENEVLQPGIHFKWPWPFEKAFYHPTYELQALWLGTCTHEEPEKKTKQSHRGHHHGPRQEKEKTGKEPILFTKEHGHEDDYFLTIHRVQDERSRGETIPVNLLAMDIFIHYRIENLYQYKYEHGNTRELLEGIANRELSIYLASTPMQDLIGDKRMEIARALQHRIQKRCDEKRMGMRLTIVGICNVHPPALVASDFEAVIGAMEEMQTKILEAEKYHNQVLPAAQSKAQEILFEAKSYLETKKTITAAEAEVFQHMKKAYENGGALYIQRKYLKILEENLSKKRILVVQPEAGKEVDVLNLEEKAADLLQLDFTKADESTSEQ